MYDEMTGQAGYMEQRAKCQEAPDAMATFIRQAHQVVQEWDALIDAYGRLLRRAHSQAPGLDISHLQLRDYLKAFARVLGENSHLVALLRRPGAEAEFRLVERPALCRLINAPRPELALEIILVAVDQSYRAAKEAGKSSYPAQVYQS